MFRRLGELVTRRSGLIVAFWFVLLIGASGVLDEWVNKTGILPWHVPTWSGSTVDGESAFLPGDMPSKRAERLYKAAFPKDLTGSTVVVVFEREDHEISDSDKAFIDEFLKSRLETMRDAQGSIITRVRTFSDRAGGSLLISDDNKSSLVLIELKTEFLEHGNFPTIQRIEDLISPQGELRDKIPAGATLSLTGSATVGRDMNAAAAASAADTERWTMFLVIGLLLAIYRAPLLALIPLITVFVAVNISVALIVLLSNVPYIGFQPFEGLKSYITVVAYGAGVDYCLFLIARYKEELDAGKDFREALAITLDKTGEALTASAMTVACGIGMMIFAKFGKFQEAGKGMALSIVIMLLASLTLTPAMLRLSGWVAFWPSHRANRNAARAGAYTATGLVSRGLDWLRFAGFWDRVGQALMKSPGKIWGTCVLVMLPFAIIGVMYHGWMSYGLLTELPRNKQSVVGTEAVQRHFLAGSAGPLTVLFENRHVDFRTPEGVNAVAELTERLEQEREKLGIADIRSVSQPLGLHRAASFAQRSLARRYYVTQVDSLDGHVARIDIVFDSNPFSRHSLKQIEQAELEINKLLTTDPKNKPRVAKYLRDEQPALHYIRGSGQHLVGTTPAIRDLKSVTDRDEVVIDGLVLLVVFGILILLLKKPATSAYLLCTVFFSYFVTLGFTFAVFWALDPAGFAGLDWKVPMFLFTILIAVGEDYNIFLMTRIDEEQKTHGPVKGVYVAQLKTGGIISSCGVIMAGTFFSLVIAGSLAGMQQLGFALSFGVLLDTFVVRPVLVPAYLILLHSGFFGNGTLGRVLGHTAAVPRPKSLSPAVPSKIKCA